MEVDESIIKQTVRCREDFACLKNGSIPCCKVERCIAEKVLFITACTSTYCNYRMPFGDGFTCNCPVRKELFLKYGV